MFIITDPAEAFRILEKQGEAEFDVANPHCAVFPYEHSLAVLLFCPEGKLKGPRLYLFVKPFHLPDVEKALINDLQTLEGDAQFEKSKTHLLEEFRKHLESRPASDYFFDAH